MTSKAVSADNSESLDPAAHLMRERSGATVAFAAFASAAGLLQANWVGAPSLIRLLVICLLLVGVGVTVTSLLSAVASRRGVSAGVAVGILVFTYFGFLEPLVPSYSPLEFLVLGVLFSVACALTTVSLVTRWAVLSNAIFWAVAAMVIMPLVLLAFRARPAGATMATGLPDVVVVFVDGYAGSETLNEIFGYTNKPFISALRRLRFDVVSDARASYSMTYASLAGVLEMRYVVEAGPLSDQTLRPGVYRLMQGDNSFVSSMADAGYRYIHVESGWGGTRCGSAPDHCIAAPFLEETVWSYSQRTALGPMMRVWYGHAFLVDGLDRLEALGKLEMDPTVPELVVAHILLPHPPLLLDSSCDHSYEPNLAFMIGGHPNDAVELKAMRRSAYLEQLECVNSRLLEVLEGSEFEESVVVIMGDHGSDSQGQLVTPVANWTDSMIKERMSTITAIRGCGDGATPETTINTLRFVQHCVFGSPYEALRERRFLVPVAANHPEDNVIEISVP